MRGVGVSVCDDSADRGGKVTTKLLKTCCCNTPLTFDNLINELDIDENGDIVVDEASDDEFSFSENYLPKRKKRKLEEKKM